VLRECSIYTSLRIQGNRYCLVSVMDREVNVSVLDRGVSRSVHS
jgi:hypothetical protein